MQAPTRRSETTVVFPSEDRRMYQAAMEDYCHCMLSIYDLLMVHLLMKVLYDA